MANKPITFQVGSYHTLPCHFLFGRTMRAVAAYEGEFPFRAEYVVPQYGDFPYELSRECLHQASADYRYALEVINSWKGHIADIGYSLQFLDDPQGEKFKRLDSHTELATVILRERLHLEVQPLWDEFAWLLAFKWVQAAYRADENRDANYQKHADALDRAAKKYPHGDRAFKILSQALRYIQLQKDEWGTLPPLLNVKAPRQSSDEPVTLFYSYSHKDEALRDELEKHLTSLQRNKKITQWHDRRIGPGDEWRGQIDQHLKSAELILLLISSDFIASGYCYDIEMEEALRRHTARESTVVPISLRPVDWQDMPFAELQALPRDAKPVTTWSNQDEALLDVARGIRSVVTDISLKRGKS